MKIYVNGKAVNCREGELLSEVLAECGAFVMMPCGGLGNCGKCVVTVACGNTKEKVRACKTTVAENMKVTTGENRCHRESRNAASGQYAVIDIGTTTVEARLLDGRGSIAAEYSCLNPQQALGADVITRISAASEGKTELLCRMIRGCCDGILESWEKEGAHIKKTAVAGNTVMLHLFAGVSPETLGTYPYTPQFTESRQVGRYTLLPSVSGYIGADITAGILALGMHRGSGVRLLCDLGTNAELVLSAGGRLYCTSAPAGPALEGACIECGMGGVDGAVCGVSLSGARLEAETVGGDVPRGICGTGLADAAAVMLKYGIVDTSGAFASEDAPLGARVSENRFYIAPEVYVSGADVRSYQLAKAAVRAGINLLLRRAGVEAEEVETVYLSGGLGSRINVRSAALTGLLPPNLAMRAQPAGNTALEGGAAALENMDEAEAVVELCQVIDLSRDVDFQAEWLNNLSFPNQVNIVDLMKQL